MFYCANLGVVYHQYDSKPGKFNDSKLGRLSAKQNDRNNKLRNLCNVIFKPIFYINLIENNIIGKN